MTFYGNRKKYIGEKDKFWSPNVGHLEDLWTTQRDNYVFEFNQKQWINR